MPIIVKPVIDLNNPNVPGLPFDVDKRSDGFDPVMPYQMVPLGKTREMVVQSGNFPADLHLTLPDVATMFNFRILSQTTPSPATLPAAGTSAQKVILPARSVVQFTLFGRKPGVDTLVGLDLPAGAPSIPGISMTVSVKALNIRRVAVVYLFDRVNRDTGRRGDFFGHLSEVDRIFFDQANFSIQNVDGIAVNTRAARTLTITGSVGRVLDVSDSALRARIVDQLDAKFPTIFRDVNTVLIASPVPIRSGKTKLQGISLQLRRTSSGRRFSVLFIGPQFVRPKPKQGGKQRTPVHELENTIAHELGHALGLRGSDITPGKPRKTRGF